eukprot:m.41173 g.41173  ORF g.41173 m.41173 type:complete len:355 (+) comp9741_c0_seq1:261-1325(+)
MLNFLDDVTLGSKVYKSCVVESNGDAKSSSVILPVYIVRGKEAGPFVLVLAGVHGDEFEPMAAVQDLYKTLDPTVMHGGVVCIGCCNPGAYENASRCSPEDSSNLARVFPGDASGTITERIAHVIHEKFICHTDVALVIDLHSAGKIYKMVPLCGYNVYADPEDSNLTETSRKVAHSMALPLTWGHVMDVNVAKSSKLGEESSGRTSLFGAYLARKPHVYCETTGTGGLVQDDVTMYTEALSRALHHMGILSASVENKPGVTMYLCEPSSDDVHGTGHLQSQNCSPTEGLFRVCVSLWESVTKGQKIGVVTDIYGGKELHQCVADKTGIVILLRHVSRVAKGDALVVIVNANVI